MRERDHPFHEETISLCSHCLERVPAEILVRGGAVFLRKSCPAHGVHEELLEEDAAFFVRQGEYDRPGTESRVETAVERGCPYDCGLCPEHEQHTCIGLLEVTGECGLGCPVCYAGARSGRHVPLGDIERMLDHFQEAESGKAEIVQVSGGEPTQHPQILEILRLARQKRIRYVMLNTNGVRIAEEPDFAAALGEFSGGFEVYLQFDGLEAAGHRALRGRDLRDVKQRALENLAAHRVPVTLVATVQGGVNDHEVGSLVEFGIRTPGVRGINFQPLAFFGRAEGIDPGRRVTLTGVLRRIEAQMGGMLRMADFIPLPCDVRRVAITLLYRDGGQFVPLTRRADVRGYLSLLKDTLAFYAEDVLQQAAQSPADGSGICTCMRFLKDLAPLAPLAARGLLARDKVRFATDNLFRITVSSFLDRYNFDMKAMRKECVHVLRPDGRRIPFSAYNLFHRGRECDGREPA